MMRDLIERLEKAEGPDRALGDEVLFACGWGCEEAGFGPDTYLVWSTPDESDTFRDGDQPNPTSSIDAALTLVPEGHDWLVSMGVGEPALAAVALATSVRNSEAEAPSPAIALCIAALKAREAVSGC
jgi:hypothetical protein